MELIETFAILIAKLIVAILFIIAYIYIDKLEQTGCVCAEHPNKNFIKNFSLFGATFLLITMFINPSMIDKKSPLMMIYAFIELMFLLMVGFYFYFTIEYVRYLVNEKCKCSESMTREFIMYGSVIEFILILIIFLHSMVIPVVSTCAISTLDSIDSTKKGINKAVRDPISSVKDFPKNMKKTINDTVSKSKSIASKLGKKLSRR
jgi:hypothetical protein